MSIYSIYFSPTQGTKKVTDLLVSEYGELEEIDLCRPIAEKRTFLKEDVCFFGVPSYGGRVPQTAIERMRSFRGNGAKAILVVVYGNRDYDDTILELYDVLKEKGFYCAAAVAAIAEHSIMRQFATGRPDKEDREQLAFFAQEIRKKLKSSVESEITVPGKRPYKEYKGSLLQPETNGPCNDCGICVRACPVCAISSGKPGGTDREECISCMRCIQICPSHARNLDETLLSSVAEKMFPLFQERKKNELFL